MMLIIIPHIIEINPITMCKQFDTILPPFTLYTPENTVILFSMLALLSILMYWTKHNNKAVLKRSQCFCLFPS